MQDPAPGQLIFAKLPGLTAAGGWEVYDSIVDLNVGDACHEYHDLGHISGTSFWCD